MNPFLPLSYNPVPHLNSGESPERGGPPDSNLCINSMALVSPPRNGSGDEGRAFDTESYSDFFAYWPWTPEETISRPNGRLTQWRRQVTSPWLNDCADILGQAQNSPEHRSSNGHLFGLSGNEILPPNAPWVSSLIMQDGPPAAKPRLEPGGTEVGNSASTRTIDRITRNYRPNSKAIIKISPIPLEPWPGATLSTYQTIAPRSSRAETPDFFPDVSPTRACKSRSPSPGLSIHSGPLLAPPEGESLGCQEVKDLTSSSPGCLGPTSSCSSCQPGYEMRPITNARALTYRPMDNNPSAQFLNGDGHIVNQQRRCGMRPPCEGRDTEGEEPASAFESSEDYSDDRTNHRPDGFHPDSSLRSQWQERSRTANIVPETSTLAEGPPPPSIPSRGTQSLIRHRDAADAFLDITQRASRQLDDSLERGTIGSQLEIETGLAPWLDFKTFGTRTKVLITAVVLGIVLLAAVMKLVQTIQPTSTH